MANRRNIYWPPCLWIMNMLSYFILFFNFLTFIYFWDRERQSMNGGGSERGRHRIRNRLQALSCQPRARRGARTHGPRDHDLGRSRTPNRLSHPGAPSSHSFDTHPCLIFSLQTFMSSHSALRNTLRIAIFLEGARSRISNGRWIEWPGQIWTEFCWVSY